MDLFAGDFGCLLAAGLGRSSEKCPAGERPQSPSRAHRFGRERSGTPKFYPPRPVRILFLSQRVPFPPNRGDKITTWRLIERLAREHPVDVVSFIHDEEDRAACAELERRGFGVHGVELGTPLQQKLRSLPGVLCGQPLTLGYYGSAKLQRVVDGLAPHADLIYAYSSSMGAFMRPYDQAFRVMHFAELDSDKWKQYAAREKFPMSWVYAREHRTLLRFEQAVAAEVDESVFCTPLEQGLFEREIPGCSSVVMRNGVDLTALQPDESLREDDHLAFCGVMDYLPNIDGCEWFAREILPRVRQQRPQARFTIVGSRPTPEVRALGELPGVHVTGFVDEPKDWLLKASVSVAPLRIARGIQNKVLEALALGLPVVGTTSATQGVEGTPEEHFLVRDDLEGQVSAVLALLEDPQRALELGRAGRRFVEERYDWEVALAPLDDLLARTAAKRGR